MAAPAAAAAPEPHDASPEVDGFDGSLLEAIAEGEVERPPGPLTFKHWIRWRAGAGRRLRSAPAVAASESALWRQVMEALFSAE